MLGSTRRGYTPKVSEGGRRAPGRAHYARRARGSAAAAVAASAVGTAIDAARSALGAPDTAAHGAGPVVLNVSPARRSVICISSP